MEQSEIIDTLETYQEMVLLKMLMEIALPKMGELLVMMMTMISPPGGKFPWQNRSAGGQKCSCPGSSSRRRHSAP